MPMRFLPTQSTRHQHHGQEDVAPRQDPSSIHHLSLWNSGKGAEGDGGAHQRRRRRNRPSSSREDGQLDWLRGHRQTDAGGVERGRQPFEGFPDVRAEPMEVKPGFRGHLRLTQAGQSENGDRKV